MTTAQTAPPPERITLHEGSITLPAGFEDRTTNVFVPADPQTQPNLNIARDWLQAQETLGDYLERQLGQLKKRMPGYKLLSRGEAQLGQAETALAGLRVDAQYKSGAQPVYQRQAAFVVAPLRALIFTMSSPRAFDEQVNALWSQWLAAFEPAVGESVDSASTDESPGTAPAGSHEGEAP